MFYIDVMSDVYVLKEGNHLQIIENALFTLHFQTVMCLSVYKVDALNSFSVAVIRHRFCNQRQ